ncbi:small RNA 2'-O-methyltransferase-like isoform X2 [Rhopilema esculentum]
MKIHCQMLEVIYGLDIDKDVLEENKFRIKPLMAEYLIKRGQPLKMALYQGSVAKPDPLFTDFDFISCIEVIEHLTKEELDAFPAAVFGILRPKTLVITTPNADFNILFPGLVGFRHPDHKFEWTRKEFNAWCEMCARQYGYSISLSFIGNGPEGTQHLGGCSQMALFTRNTRHEVNDTLLENADRGRFELITEIIYPYEPPKSVEERLSNEIRYLVNHYFNIESNADVVNHNGDSDPDMLFRSIPVKYLQESPSIKTICKNPAAVRDAVCRLYKISDDQDFVIVPFEEDKYDADFDEYYEDDVGYTDMEKSNEEPTDILNRRSQFDPEEKEWWD